MIHSNLHASSERDRALIAPIIEGGIEPKLLKIAAQYNGQLSISSGEYIRYIPLQSLITPTVDEPHNVSTANLAASSSLSSTWGQYFRQSFRSALLKLKWAV